MIKAYPLKPLPEQILDADLVHPLDIRVIGGVPVLYLLVGPGPTRRYWVRFYQTDTPVAGDYVGTWSMEAGEPPRTQVFHVFMEPLIVH